MKKNSILFASLFFISGATFSQSGLTCAHHKSHQNFERSNTLSLDYIALTEEYDVTFYFLDVEVENTSTDIVGSTEIHATSKVAVLDTFLFELHEDLAITSILLNGVTPATFTRENSAVFVDCNFTNGEQFFYEIHYGGTPPDPGSNPLGGSGITNDNSPSWGNEVTWTLSEPFCAYEWFPCKQSLTDKADSSYTFITTSSSNMAGSNGILTDIVDVGGGKFRYEWKSQLPIVYYLISIAVAEYVEYTIYANPVGAPNPVMIQNFVYNNPATLPYFQDEINNTADFIEYFSEVFGLYPFHTEKYGHCMAPLSGGMEHQTMTTQGWFEDGLTAHELAHQWFGNSVTCGSWADIWLNEGFASYAEYIMWEEFYPGSEIADMQDRHANIMEQPGGSVYRIDSLDAGAIFSGRLVYNKGAAIIHTMRFMLNDDVLFYDILQTYLSTYADTSVRTPAFKEILENLSGMDFTAFFNEWYYGQGYPTYNINYNQVGNWVYIDLNQVVSMPGVTPFFTNDLEIALTDNLGNTTYHRLTNVSGTNSFHQINYTSELVNIEIDPNNWIINEDGVVEEDPSVVGVSEEESSIVSVYPNPAKDVINVQMNNASTYQILNSLGQIVESGNLQIGNNVIALTEFAAGIYYLKTDGQQVKFLLNH